jgi:hypothetical protein
MKKDTHTDRHRVFQVLAGGPWGGGAVVVLALTRALIKANCQVWVLCLDDLVARRFAEAGAQVVRCDIWRRQINPLYDLASLWQIFRLCRRNKFDLVVTHTSKGGFLGRIAARLAGVPRVIHTAHGFAWHEFSPPWVTRFYVAPVGYPVLRRAGTDCVSLLRFDHLRQSRGPTGCDQPEGSTTGEDSHGAEWH